MGTGCQTRVNRILENYAQMRMGEVTMRNARVEEELRKIREGMQRGKF